jgi:geranylgeranyl reductase family protein
MEANAAASYDVVVAGAGPAGSTAAFVAASRGLRTLLVEKRGPPRDKTCGGLLTNRCVDLVRDIYGSSVPSEVQIPPSPMPVFVVPPSGIRQGFRVPGEDVLNVTRRAFDGWLASRAADRGADVIADSEVLRYSPAGDRMSVSLSTPAGRKEVTARFLVGGDGIYSKVREQLRPRPLVNRAYYVQEYYPRTGDFEDWFYLMYRGDTSPIYAYVIPKHDLLCLGIGIHKAVPPTFERGMTRFKAWLHDDLGFRDQGVRHREGFSVPFGNLMLGEGRVLLAGDAAGFCYPPTGEGITYAVQSGAAAAESVFETEPLRVYAAKMAKVQHAIEAAAARTLQLTDAEREERIRAKVTL